jgi:hypothetical protein
MTLCDKCKAKDARHYVIVLRSVEACVATKTLSVDLCAKCSYAMEQKDLASILIKYLEAGRQA